jgi:alpha-tubulin suppressor-like RCC1 family protein
VTGPNGSQVVIPAGALSQNTSIAITASAAGAPAQPAGLQVVSTVFAFTPHGAAFASPATVSIPFDASRVPSGVTATMFKTNAARDAWEAVSGTSIDGNVARAQVSSFSWFLVGFMSTAPSITAEPADQTVFINASATFSVVATGDALQYQWQRASANSNTFADIAGATSASYTIASAQSADADARFRVVVSNAAASITSRHAVLFVGATPTSRSTRIAAGGQQSFALLANGQAVSWGLDRQVLPDGTVIIGGHLGAGPADDSRSVPGPVTALTDIISISSSDEHSVAVLSNGEVWGWGANDESQLALASGPGNDFVEEPRQIAGVTDAIAACAGAAHSLFLLRDGSVLAVGRNFFGQLGTGTPLAENATPEPVVDLQGVVAISCGGNHNLALLADGTLRAWGRNNFASDPQASLLGDGTTIDRSTPVEVTGLTNVVAIAAGGFHSLALRSSGEVWAWGFNAWGQLGTGNVTSQLQPTPTLANAGFSSISAGPTNSFAIRGGQAFGWGINDALQLAADTSPRFYSAVPLHIEELDSVAEIAVYGHVIALRTDGTVWTWGSNEEGQLGHGTRGADDEAPRQIDNLNLN